MTTGSNSRADKPSDIEQGKQRQNNIKKVLSNLPSRSKDNFLLLLLFVMGITGFAYILNVPVGNNLNKSSLFDKLFNSKNSKAMTANFIKSNFVKINGEKKRNTPMLFTFQQLSESHDYEIHFGDEVSSSIAVGQMEHTYSNPGTYKIELKKINDARTIVVHCEYVTIQ